MRHAVRLGANAVCAVFRQERDSLRPLQVAHVSDRPLRDLLLPRDRTAPRTDGGLRRERVSTHQLRAEARPGRQGAADPVPDQRRVLSAERDSRRGAGRRRGLRRAEPLPHPDADGRAAGSALPADRARADAHLPVRHHPHVAHPQPHAALGARGHERLHDRRVAPERHHDGARRRHRRHHPEDEQPAGLRRSGQPARDLQPRARGVRVHGGALGQGGRAAVRLCAAQEHHRRRRRRLPGSLSDHGGRVGHRVRSLSERALQAVPRQGAARRLRPQPRAGARQDPLLAGLFDRAIAVGRPDRRHDRQLGRSRARHRAAVDQGRPGDSQPHARLRSVARLRVHRAARRTLEHRAVDVVVAVG